MTLSAQKRKRFAFAFLLAMVLCEVAVPLRLIPKLRNGYQDFTIFYTGALLVGSGHASSLYDLNAQFRTQQSFTRVPIRLGPLPFNHPPFEALFFVPLSWLTYWHAYLVWTILNVGMLVACVLLLKYLLPQFADVPRAFLFLGSMAYFPTIMALVQGQDLIALLLLFVLAFVALERKKDEIAGALFGIGLYRPQFAVPMILLIAIRRWRILLGFGPVAALLGIVTVWLMGWNGPVNYVRFVLHLEASGSRAFEPKDVPNLRGIISNLPELNPSGLPAHLLIIGVSLIVMVFSMRRIARGKDSIQFVSSLAVVTTMLVSFHSFVNDLILLLPISLLLMWQVVRSERNEQRTLGSVLAVLLFLTPLYVALVISSQSFYLFSLVLIGLFVEMLRSPSAAEVPA